MQAKGFFGSLFDYSFSSYITPKIIRVLYVLATILVALDTLAFILLAFRASSTFGILALLIFGPIGFVIGMIFARVGLEVLSAFFRIHGDVDEINQRGGGSGGTPPAFVPTKPGPARADADEPSSETTSAAASMSAPESTVAVAPAEDARFCDNCGTERSPGKRFCTGCGASLA